MTYTVPKGVRLANMHGYGGAEILFLDQETLIGDTELHGGLYSFESDNFIQIFADGEKTDQWVSGQPVSLQATAFKPVRNISDIMKSGVQIYQVNDAEGYSADMLHKDMHDLDFDDVRIRVLTKRLVAEGKLRWLNEERGLRADDCLDPQNSTAANSGYKPDIFRP